MVGILRMKLVILGMVCYWVYMGLLHHMYCRPIILSNPRAYLNRGVGQTKWGIQKWLLFLPAICDDTIIPGQRLDRTRLFSNFGWFEKTKADQETDLWFTHQKRWWHPGVFSNRSSATVILNVPDQLKGCKNTADDFHWRRRFPKMGTSLNHPY